MHPSRAAVLPTATDLRPNAWPLLLPRTVWRLLGMAILATSIWVVYRPALDDPFVFDDSVTIVNNASIDRLWPLWDATAGTSPLHPPIDSPVRSRPLVNLSLAVNHHFGLLDPVGYRATNLAIHLITALLLWAIVARTLRLDYFAERLREVAEPLGFATAIVWALHPLVTESVVYVTQRTELLMGMLYLATLYASLRYWATERAVARAAWLVLAATACVSGMLCKEMMASAPAMVWLYERTFVTGSFRSAWRRSWPLYLGLSLAWIPIALVNLNGPSTPASGFGLGVSAYSWWLTQTKVLVLYLKLAVWPWPLVIHYEIPYFTTFRDAWPWALGAGALVVATLVLVGRRSSVGYVFAWVLVVLSPTLLIPLVTETAAERRMYVPLAALAALLVVGSYSLLCRLTERFEPGTARWATGLSLALLIGLTAIFAAVSGQRLLAYHDELTLWQDAALHQPQDPLVRANLGIALDRSDRHHEAIAEFTEAVRLEPSSFQTQYNFARALESSGKLDEAVDHYQEALRLQPDHAASHCNLGRLLAARGDSQAAARHYEMAIDLDPRLPEAHSNLGTLLISYGHTRAAIEHFKQALQLRADSTAHFNLAVGYAHDGRMVEATAMARKAISLARAEGNDALAEQFEAALASHPQTSP